MFYKKGKKVSDTIAIGFTITLVVIGALLLAAGYIDHGLFDFDDTILIYFRKLGEFIFVAGAFAAFLKTIQIMNVIRDDLSEILYSEKFMTEYLDVGKLWERLYKLIHRNLYPSLPEFISNKIIEKNKPNDIDYYIEKLVLNFEVRWADKNNGTISISRLEQKKIKIVRAEASIVMRNFYSPAGNHENAKNYVIHDITIDGESIENKEQRILNYDGRLISSSFPITKDCDFSQTISFEQNINADPICIYSMTRFVNKMSVKVLVMSDDLAVSFLPYGGSDEWVKSNADFLNSRILEASINDLYFPNQGFILLFKSSN